MKIEHDLAQNLYKVVDPLLEVGEVYLSSEIPQYLESQGKLEFLEDMQFVFSVPKNSWEISDTIPAGDPRTLASVIFYVSGSIQRRNDKYVLFLN